jgi:hypothetical protein
MKKRLFASAVAALMVFAVTTAFGQFSFDENGGGFGPSGPIPGFLSPEPFSGIVTLTYSLPFPVAPGDVVLYDPQTGLESDIFRFGQDSGVGNPPAGSALWVFSDYEDNDPNPDLADVGLPPPVAALPTVGPFPEIGPEGNNYFDWMPLPGSGDPGDAGAGTTVVYRFISDIPEPGTVTLVGLSLVGLLAISRRRK